ncbi:MAG: M56 family metallopeptidase [Bacteroidia bacterium]|nr:M56 family metallopeptidase [Bacteroidia bacterium]
MIAWLITSMLLSITGMLIYLPAVKLVSSPRHRKLFLYSVLGLSLILPFFIHSHPHTHEFQPNPFQPSEFAANAYIPQTVEEYCHCEEPGKGEMILYKASMVYDFFLEHNQELMVLPAIIAFILLLRLFCQVRVLRHLTRGAEAKTIRVSRQKINLLRTAHKIPAASFFLIRPYMIWNPVLDGLGKLERKAVMAHEISHLKQFNTWEEIFLQLLQTIWLLNPAYYMMRFEFRKLSEFIADDAALESGISGREYALLLLKLKTQPLPLGSQGISGSLLKQRIERIALPVSKRSPWVLPLLALTFLTLVGVNHFSKTVIEDQMEDLEIYEYLSHTNKTTGKTAFCKSCTYEKVLGTSGEGDSLESL